MTLLTHTFDQVAVIVTTETDKYGDQKSVSNESIACRFRYITGVEKNLSAEALNSEAMVWFEPDANISEANILLIEGSYWRIDKLVKARRFDKEVQFLKAFVTKHELVTEAS